jgi:hypothetical protein
MKRIVLSVAITCLISSANAQWASTPATTTPQAGQRYVVLGGTSQADSASCFVATGFCVNSDGINLNAFANANDVASSFSSTNSSVTTLQGQLATANTTLAGLQGQVGNANAAIASIQGQLAANDKAIGKLYDLVAVSAAMRDAIPNGDDRFALRLNMGGYGGHVAGGIGGSFNLDQTIRFSVNYGLGKHEQMFSGGMNFSFH